MQVIFGALAFATSPLGVVQLVMILAMMPLHIMRTVVGFFAPSLFYKDIKGETILITVSACVRQPRQDGLPSALTSAALHCMLTLSPTDVHALDTPFEHVHDACAQRHCARNITSATRLTRTQ